jgi:Tol biopolymer transport system component
LYTIQAWGTKAKKLAEIGFWEPWSLRWSPDGKYIAGFAYINNEDENHVMIVSTQNGAIKRLSAKDENKYKEGLEWHPGSKKLTYMYYDPKNDNDGLREAYVDGRPTTPFINQPKIWDWLGRWDPDGMNYYFKGAYRGTWNLYRYNSVSKKTTLFSEITNTLLPSWNKDGKFMVLSKKTREYQLWMMKGIE